VGITVINEDMSIDEATQEIIGRTQQLCDVASRDKQSLINTLQHKLRTLKERLDLKVIDATSRQSILTGASRDHV